MGTLLHAGYESQTSGTVPTAANSDDFGDAPISIGPVVGTGGAVTYDTTQPAHGTKCVKVVSASGAATYVPYAFAAANATANLSFYFWYTAAPTTAEMSIAGVSNGSGTMMKIIINTAGTVRLRDSASASPTGASAMTALVPGTMYRFELQLIHGVGTADGQFTFAYYSYDGTTAISGGTASGSTANLGTADFTKAYFGRVDGSTAGTYTGYYDDVQIREGMTAGSLIGPYGTAVPVANAGIDQSATSGDTVVVAGSATNTPTSYAWTQTGGASVGTLTGASTATMSFTAPTVTTSTAYTFSFTATNGAGTSTADTVVITVAPAGVGLLNTFEGQTNGGTVSPANSANSGDAFYTVVPGAGATCTYSTAHASGGAGTSILFTNPGGVNSYAAMNLPASNNTANIAFWMYWDGQTLTSEIPLGSIGGGSVIALTTAGVVRLRNAAGGNVTGATAIYTLVSGHSYRFEMQNIAGADITSGIVHFALYDNTAPTTAVATINATAENVGTVPYTQVIFGRSGTATSASTLSYDDVQAAGGLPSGSWLGVPGSGVPNANAGADQANVDAGSLVTLTATATHSPTSYSWTQTAGPTVTLSSTTSGTVTFIAPSTTTGTTLTFSVTASNANGTGSADTVNVVVLIQPEWVLTAAGVWVGATENLV